MKTKSLNESNYLHLLGFTVLLKTVKQLCLWQGSLLLWGRLFCTPPFTQHINENHQHNRWCNNIVWLQRDMPSSQATRTPELQTFRIKNLINCLIVPLQHSTSPLNSQRCSHRYPCICPLPAICWHKGVHLLQACSFLRLNRGSFSAQSLQSSNKCTVLMHEKRKKFFVIKANSEIQLQGVLCSGGISRMCCLLLVSKSHYFNFILRISTFFLKMYHKNKSSAFPHCSRNVDLCLELQNYKIKTFLLRFFFLTDDCNTLLYFCL